MSQLALQKVKFVEDAEIRDHNNVVTESFKAGEVHELTPDRAFKWIRRNKAESVVETPEAPAPKAKKSADKSE